MPKHFCSSGTTRPPNCSSTCCQQQGYAQTSGHLYIIVFPNLSSQLQLFTAAALVKSQVESQVNSQVKSQVELQPFIHSCSSMQYSNRLAPTQRAGSAACAGARRRTSAAPGPACSSYSLQLFAVYNSTNSYNL
jgi:hypothetical protein